MKTGYNALVDYTNEYYSNKVDCEVTSGIKPMVDISLDDVAVASTGDGTSSKPYSISAK